MDDVVVYKNRTNVLVVELGVDVSNDEFFSQIREKSNNDSLLLATWTTSFETDGVDGLVRLTLDDSDLQNITAKSGYMDIKRVSGGEPLQVFEVIKVKFENTVTE